MNLLFPVLSTDSILVKVPPLVGMTAMSEMHRAECLKLISRLSSVHVNLELGAQQVQLREMHAEDLPFKGMHAEDTPFRGMCVLVS